MQKILISFVVLCFCASDLSAHGQVWFDAVPAAGNGIIVGGNAPGQALVTDQKGLSSFIVTVHYTLADSGATGWALDFYGNTGCTSVSDLITVSQGFPVGVNHGSIANVGGVLMQGLSGQNITGGTGPGDFVLATFRLTDSGCGFGVLAGIGDVEFGGNDPDAFDIYELVQIGSNPYRPGYSLGGGDPLGAEPLPVILLNVPEPSAISMLALASVLYFRKPRKNRNSGHD